MSATVAAGYVLGDQLERDAQVSPYLSRSDMPVDWRSLRVYAVDPSLPAAAGEVHLIRVPYEALGPGPAGGLFEVDMTVGGGPIRYRMLNLDDPALLRSAGVDPDEADAGFHGQMVYGVASLTYEAFRRALGRQPGWAFRNRTRDQPNRLTLVPFAMEEANASYSRSEGRVCFGYVRSDSESVGDLPPEKTFFTSLSADIVAHEVTHALLDGLRPYFREPTGPDVPAFHEAFADLMAIFQRFQFEGFVRAQIRGCNGDVTAASLLNVVAPELAQVIGKPFGVRNFMAQRGRGLDERDRPVTIEEAGDECHARGAVLAEAVFEAFVTIAQRRTTPLIRLATRGRERLQDGELSAELLDEICEITRKVAAQFRRMCIRAIDYCPPVDLNFGDYLRALVTADRELVQEDPHGYREALVSAFRRRRLYPGSVGTMSERSLLWNAPQRRLAPVAGLSLDRLRFDGDPGGVPRVEDVRWHATCLGDAILADPAFFRELGLSADSGAGPFEIASLRPARRAGPDGQVAFDLIAEVVQQRPVPLPDGRTIAMRGGATVILDAWGMVQFIVRKNIASKERQDALTEYVAGAGARFWNGEAELTLAPGAFRSFCLMRDEEPTSYEAADADAAAAEAGGTPASRDIVGKTWVRVENPPGVSAGHRVIVDGALPLTTGRPVQIAPGGRHKYRLERGDGVVFGADVIAPAGRTRAAPFSIALARTS